MPVQRGNLALTAPILLLPVLWPPTSSPRRRPRYPEPPQGVVRGRGRTQPPPPVLRSLGATSRVSSKNPAERSPNGAQITGSAQAWVGKGGSGRRSGAGLISKGSQPAAPLHKPGPWGGGVVRAHGRGQASPRSAYTSPQLRQRSACSQRWWQRLGAGGPGWGGVGEGVGWDARALSTPAAQFQTRGALTRRHDEAQSAGHPLPARTQTAGRGRVAAVGAPWIAKGSRAGMGFSRTPSSLSTATGPPGRGRALPHWRVGASRYRCQFGHPRRSLGGSLETGTALG